MAREILIIKLGYCETLVNEQGFQPSLGDVFRHTVLLHRYAGDRVTWLTSRAAVPLLKGNSFIANLLTYEDLNPEELAAVDYDEIVCLEKAEVICTLAKGLRARRRFGFGWNGNKPSAHPLAQSALNIANGKDHFLPIQALLYQMVRDYWRGEDYILGYRPRPMPACDVGLNFRVGSKWPTKAWPMNHWSKLEALCKKAGLQVSWQEGEKDIEHYMDWINSCRLVVTCDSLGMHLGLALKKKVIALFGSTPSDSIYMYGRGVIIRANWACPLAPCMKSSCDCDTLCMREIEPETIFRAVANLLGDASATHSTNSARLPVAARS
jgi:heptosyltransferase-2